MSSCVECDVFDDPGRTDPFLHRLLCPAPFQTFEHQTVFFRTVAYQFQCFMLIGMMSSVLVFWVMVWTHFPPAAESTISSQQRERTSLSRRLVRHEKREAVFRTGILHGVSARQYSSSILRYSLATSSGLIFSRKSLTLVFIILLRYRIFRNPRKVDQ